MGTDSQYNEKPETRGGDVIALSLPEFLNIFFRGRWIILGVAVLGLLAGLIYGWVTKPLYLGTVQVRPGIVSFTDTGDALRGWALKDVVQWFETSRYWGDMSQLDEFKDWTGAPVITAEFIPIGLQWTPGGNIITLTNLSRDRERSRIILQEAVCSFNRQAMSDSNDSDIELALSKARIRIQDYRNDIEKLLGDEERAQVDIKTKQGMLKLLEAQGLRIEFDRERFLEQKTWRSKAIASAEKDLESARSRLEQAQRMLEVALESEALEGAGPSATDVDDNPVTTILLTSARREQAGRVVQLLDSIGRLERYLFDGQVKIDTLSVRINTIDIALEDLDLKESVDLVQRRERILDEISMLEIELERDLPHSKIQIENKLATEEMKISKLEALEQISPIQVSPKPVRPRKARAALILMALGLFGGCCLVLLKEYYVKNRAAITAR